MLRIPSVAAFTPTVSLPLRAPSSKSKSPSRCCRPAPWSACTSAIPNSPTLLVRWWENTRTISSTVDLSRRFISVLFLSNNCHRAAVAEKQLINIAETYCVSRRLLILSAGIHSQPGDILPLQLISAARQRNIDISHERPCASFDISDLDYYDFLVVVDRNVRDRLMRMAEAHAHTSGGHLYEWERKIRLLCDFEGVRKNMPTSAGFPLDVPTFNSGLPVEVTMDRIDVGCQSVIRSLVSAGLQ